jgi:glycosyltransferase involved in cell wall biosynthesis
MKIGMFADSFLPDRNGLVTFVCGLTRELIERDISVSIYVPGEKTGTESYCGAPVYRLKSYSLPFYPGYRLSLLEARKVIDILKKDGVDVYHIHDPFPIGMAAMRSAKRKRKPIVGTFHTRFAEYFPYHAGRFLFTDATKKFGSDLAWIFLRNFYKRCSIVTVPTLEMSMVLRGQGIDRLTVISNGVDLKDFRPMYVKKEARRVLDVPEEAVVFLYLGRMSLEKRIDVLLKAYKTLEEDDTLLMMVGSGPQRENYEMLAEDLGIEGVKFFGGVPNNLVSALYYASDVFVSPSDTETFGLTFLEAMTCGLPVIGVDAGGAGEIIMEGENGLKARPNDVGDLALKMRLLKEDEALRKRMGENSSRIVRDYSIEKVAEKFISLYKSYC